MRKSTVCFLALIIGLSLSVTEGFCQPPGGGLREGAPPTDEIKDKMERVRGPLKLERLAKALGLDEAGSARLSQLLEKYAERRDALGKETRDDMRLLREALQAGGDEGKLKPLIKKIEQNHSARRALAEEKRAAIKGMLTVKQQAQYILSKVRFMREMRRLGGESGKRREGGQDRPMRPEGVERQRP